MPPSAGCAEHLATPTTATTVPSGALAMVGFDFGPRCAATVLHLDERNAYLVAARHCLVRVGVPPSRARVYLPREDKDGMFWEPRPIRRVFVGPGGEHVEPWDDFVFDLGDWSVLEVERDPTMVAIPLADAPLREHIAATLVTVRPQDYGTYRPCLHARGLDWGEVASLGIGGYSGAAIVANGRVQGLFVGYRERGLLLFRRVDALRIVPAESIGRPWLAGPTAPATGGGGPDRAADAAADR